jgi:hypothetical protein
MLEGDAWLPQVHLGNGRRSSPQFVRLESGISLPRSEDVLSLLHPLQAGNLKAQFVFPQTGLSMSVGSLVGLALVPSS